MSVSGHIQLSYQHHIPYTKLPPAAFPETRVCFGLRRHIFFFSLKVEISLWFFLWNGNSLHFKTFTQPPKTIPEAVLHKMHPVVVTTSRCYFTRLWSQALSKYLRYLIVPLSTLLSLCAACPPRDCQLSSYKCQLTGLVVSNARGKWCKTSHFTAPARSHPVKTFASSESKPKIKQCLHPWSLSQIALRLRLSVSSLIFSCMTLFFGDVSVWPVQGSMCAPWVLTWGGWGKRDFLP